ncbi:DUF3810 domain-containing protein [Solitalea sp. MAHUQ-68]|uniref:DUF3810 domain-containing protein n=1 Tax=Solitalea agri TaxID=2953739 RepID=A0A9X2EYM2_9SPHI|nr:DUF3810 domain-containing protein [Solitalea agri]MCO4291392.1 DUF3810 domain-containing protein [Solitalea agri]
MDKQLKINVYWLATLLLLLFVFRLIGDYTLLIENVYFGYVYKFISGALRLITGWLPFSLGDVFYSIVILLVLLNTIKFVRTLIKTKEKRWTRLLSGLVKAGYLFIGAYLIFQICWGFNYFREPLSEQMNISTEKVEKEQLTQLALFLAKRVNETHLKLTNDSLKQYKSTLSTTDLYEIAKTGYKEYPSFNFKFYSTKTSLYKKLMNYSGIGGYYNPFSGEAQVNTDPPKFSLPFTICHEMAHQSGISAEQEANFVGYLTALKTNNTFFIYSAELEAFMYTAGELGRMDSVARKQCYRSLNKGVKEDIKEYRKFWMSYSSAIEPYFEWYYDWFLKTNNQPKGIRSYNEFVNLLVGYYDQKSMAQNK